MRSLVLNGAAEGDSAVDMACEAVCDGLRRAGSDVEALCLRDLNIPPCGGDFWCWVRTPGACSISEIARAITEKAVRSDRLVLVTRVTFGGYSSELKKALDHLIGMILPFFTKIDGEVHHKPRYRSYPVLSALGVLPAPDDASEAIFRTLVGRNAINLHSPANTVGFVYGSTSPDEMREQVLALVANAGVAA